MTREELTATMLHTLGDPVPLNDEARAAKELLVEHFRGRGGLVPALMQYRQEHPTLSFEDAILGLFAETCG